MPYGVTTNRIATELCMDRVHLRDKLRDRTRFLVLAELTGGPGFSLAPIEKFLQARQEKADAIPAEFDLAAITLPQSPGGVANIEPASVISRMQAQGLLAGLDVVPHVTCKDMNADAIVSSLMSFRSAGVESLLALTGDKPAKAAGVFELESLGLLRLIRRINRDGYLQANPRSLGAVHQFFPGAAVSPFKYTEASQMQQYYKMEKKIACGAEFLITQVGWDWRKSLELFTYLKEVGLAVPVIGNVYLLSTLTPAPRLMHDGKLPGCFVSDELLAQAPVGANRRSPGAGGPAGRHVPRPRCRGRGPRGRSGLRYVRPHPPAGRRDRHCLGAVQRQSLLAATIGRGRPRVAASRPKALAMAHRIRGRPSPSCADDATRQSAIKRAVLPLRGAG